jgi:hypothetical protein
MKLLSSIGITALLAIGLSSLPGCSASRNMISRVTSAEGGKLYAVGVEKAPFYKFGPQQGNGPDQELPRDTLVRLVRNSFGYSKVVIEESGQQGFVASENLTVASAALVAAATATPPPQIASSSSTSSSAAGESFDVESVTRALSLRRKDCPRRIFRLPRRRPPLRRSSRVRRGGLNRA